MKILILSDLHLEFEFYPYEFPEVDVIILAGDIGVGTEGIEFADWVQNVGQVPVIYVTGNHEFYNNLSIKEGTACIEKYMEKVDSKVYFLNNSYVDIDGVRFVGGTLWTDFLLNGDKTLNMINVSCGLNDSQKIGLYDPEKIAQLHEETKESIRYAFSDTSMKKVVVTHYLPSEKSIHEQYKDNYLNSGFASNCEDVISDINANLWIHGHTHSSCDYVLGNTRIVCNPKGYHNENKEFNPNFVVEI